MPRASACRYLGSNRSTIRRTLSGCQRWPRLGLCPLESSSRAISAASRPRLAVRRYGPVLRARQGRERGSPQRCGNRRAATLHRGGNADDDASAEQPSAAGLRRLLAARRAHPGGTDPRVSDEVQRHRLAATNTHERPSRALRPATALARRARCRGSRDGRRQDPAPSPDGARPAPRRVRAGLPSLLQRGFR